MFAPVYDQYSPFVDDEVFILRKIEGMGRPHQIRPEYCLGLLLSWSHIHGSMMVPQLIFDMIMSPLAKYLQITRQIVIKILKKDPIACIALPMNVKLEEY